MNIIIQSVPERQSNVDIMLKKVPNAVVIRDNNKIGNMPTFLSSLKLHQGYTLRLQDDIIIPNGFSDYLEKIENHMRENDLHVVSLFSMKRNELDGYYKGGHGIYPYRNFIAMLAVVFSPLATEKMKEYVPITEDEKKHDDIFVRECFKKNKIKTYVHLPSLVQHRIDIKSMVGHPQSITRTSNTFDKDFITNEISRDKNYKPE